MRIIAIKLRKSGKMPKDAKTYGAEGLARSDRRVKGRRWLNLISRNAGAPFFRAHLLPWITRLLSLLQSFPRDFTAWKFCVDGNPLLQLSGTNAWPNSPYEPGITYMVQSNSWNDIETTIGTTHASAIQYKPLKLLPTRSATISRHRDKKRKSLVMYCS